MSASVLIVDDDEIIRETVSLMLCPLGYAVREAADGNAAIALLLVRRPDLILLDQDMPGMNGFDFLARAKADFRLRGVPALMLTADRRPSTVLRARALGAVGFVAKPFVGDELLLRIRSVMNRASAPAWPQADMDRAALWLED